MSFSARDLPHDLAGSKTVDADPASPDRLARALVSGLTENKPKPREFEKVLEKPARERVGSRKK